MSEAGAKPDENLEPSFLTILYTMATQAMIALGDIPNPMTKQAVVDEKQARWHVKSLEILHQKTQGNLSEEEAKALDGVLDQVRKKFADKIG